jgi:hypothetical protein
VSDEWTIRHFSQSNPSGPNQGDVGALLRRVADTVESFAGIDVHDIVFHNDVTADGEWPSVTVYFHLPEDHISELE